MADIRLPKNSGQYFYENAPVFYVLFNRSGQVIATNRYTEDLIGDDLFTLAAADIFLDFAGPVDIAALRENPEKTRMLAVSTASGLPETFLCHFMPEGEDTLAIGCIDAEETQRLRQEMLALNNELNGLTRELQKKTYGLEELNHLKNHFLGMAAHDLRNPVGAILSYSDFLLEEAGGNLSSEHLGFLRTIRTSADLMRHLIDTFLNISLIESGHFDLNLAAVDIRRPVEHSMALQQILADKRRIILHLVHPDSPIVLQMDEYKIEQVLNNLISNALEHSPPGSAVTVEIVPSPAGVAVAISDAGPGIGEEDRARLFRPYERGQTPKPAGSRSTGLGLAISKKIVEAHHGRIWVENRSGQGASFCFLLPATGSSQGAAP